MRAVHTSTLLLCLLALSACTSLLQKDTARAQNSVRIADGIDLQLQVPASNTTQLQKIDAQYRNKHHSLLMQVQTRNGVLDMAGMTMTGTRLFSLSFDGEQSSSWQSPLFTVPFDGTYVLADHQFATLPAAILQQALSRSARIEERDHANGEKVRLLLNRESRIVVEVRYRSGNRMRYCHHERGYCLDITILNAAQ